MGVFHDIILESESGIDKNQSGVFCSNHELFSLVKYESVRERDGGRGIYEMFTLSFLTNDFRGAFMNLCYTDYLFRVARVVPLTLQPTNFSLRCHLRRVEPVFYSRNCRPEISIKFGLTSMYRT